jgi:AcrR family transcriptional regulator
MPALALAPEVERARLLEAGHAVLAREGYDGLKVEAVLDTAGLSTRAFYRHFDGKSALFLALFTDEVDRSSARLAAAVEAASTPAGQVRAWLDAVLSLGFDRERARRARGFMTQRGLLEREFPEAIAACLAGQRTPLKAAIEGGVAAGTFTSPDPDADALAIHHLCLGLLGDALTGAGALDEPAAVALVERFALATLEGPSRQEQKA